jgi:hypothetical protein
MAKPVLPNSGPYGSSGIANNRGKLHRIMVQKSFERKMAQDKTRHGNRPNHFHLWGGGRNLNMHTYIFVVYWGSSWREIGQKGSRLPLGNRAEKLGIYRHLESHTNWYFPQRGIQTWKRICNVGGEMSFPPLRAQICIHV